MLYFAYGSNMDWAQMRQRCPSARFVFVAKLTNHRLAFTRKSQNRQCGVADAAPKRGSRIWGVVYEIEEREVGQLDRSEGFRPGRAGNAYTRKERHVIVGGDENKPMAVWVYFAKRQPEPPPPNAKYKRQIIEGAKFWRLPDRYIRELENIEVAT